MKKSKHFLSIVVIATTIAASCMLAGCKKDNPEPPQTNEADLVVFGKIFTSETDSAGGFIYAKAFAVKDGKFIYIGDSAGALAYIKDDVTKIIDHTGKSIVIPGCYEGHAHYMMANAMPLMGGPTITLETDVATFMSEVADAYQRAKTAGKSSVFGFGWDYQAFLTEGMPTRQQLDSVCPDVALYINDSEGHKGLVNTKCLQNAGILDNEGNVLIAKIRGGEICMDANGKPTGLLKEQAGTYVRNHGINFNEIFPSSLGMQAVAKSQEQLLANGYVSYMDGWSNYYGTDAFYEGAKSLEEAGTLHILLGMSYEFESSTASVEDELDKAIMMKKYSKGHIYADYVKIFIDGTVESGTGFTLEPYQVSSFGNGIANWEESEVAAITRKANAAGLTMHVHTMGDAAVHRAVNAFESAGTKELRNTIVHTRNVPDADFQRIAANNIVAVAGMLWHGMPNEMVQLLNKGVPENLIGKAYPMKSYFNAGVIMTSHCDFPATTGAPNDPFGIMEIAVSGQVQSDGGLSDPFWYEECITREQALLALTINGAYQMHVENERGSIKVGKYADFVLVDKDVLECAQEDIHNAKVVSTWFEGKQVYPAK